MKRLILLTLLFALLSVNAAAEIVGTTPQLENIHRYTAPNGQEIYYISREEEWATVQQADVNFDGHDDLVFLITQGASNGFFMTACPIMRLIPSTGWSPPITRLAGQGCCTKSTFSARREAI